MLNFKNKHLTKSKNNCFNLDNLEPDPGRPASELEVKARKIV